MVKRIGRDDIFAQIPAARAAGQEIQREPWWPVAVGYDPAADMVCIELRDGKALHVPRSHIAELADASREQLQRVELAGEAIRWDDLDVDASVLSLLSELLGPRYSTREAGRLGGSTRSEAKSAAARSNGTRGGRPRKR